MKHIALSVFVTLFLFLLLFSSMAAQAVDIPEDIPSNDTGVVYRYLHWKMELGQPVIVDAIWERYVTTETISSQITTTVDGIWHVQSIDSLEFPFHRTLTPVPLQWRYWNDFGFYGMDYNFSDHEFLLIRYELGCRPGPTFDLRIFQGDIEDTILLKVVNTTDYPLRV